MYPGLPSRLERELKQLYLDRVLKGNTESFQVIQHLHYEIKSHQENIFFVFYALKRALKFAIPLQYNLQRSLLVF